MGDPTVKVQGNDISHKLQISRVGKSDEGLYECRVTRANYGEIIEYKAQAWLRVNATVRPRRPLEPPKKSSPLHLTDKKPRKSNSPLGQDSMSSDQRVASTSTSHTSSNSGKQNPDSGRPPLERLRAHLLTEGVPASGCRALGRSAGQSGATLRIMFHIEAPLFQTGGGDSAGRSGGVSGVVRSRLGLHRFWQCWFFSEARR
ncbi:V-set and transmembrane domain-containing protein 2A [Liparis tanakae]|uniref:V-set and transmembrane domain-containing protein 2A n=1 Tax=Liparis tanakae TaxID=230148 RepID=A0A4Z2G4L4_9TELE|nr:V-set and transmembrane domain-containing protein 2A [Liparis tanakae]